MNDEPDAETATWRHTTLTSNAQSCSLRVSNSQSQQARSRRSTLLHRAATGIGPVYEWDNVEIYVRAGQATDINIIRRMRMACRVTRVTDSEYVILLQQQWLCDRASLLRLYLPCWSCWESQLTVLEGGAAK